MRALLLLWMIGGLTNAQTITTIAGGYTGDGGPATLADLSGPTGIAMAADGSLYIADTRNHRIRMVAPDGTISTIAGTGTSGYTGDGGPATSAELNFPRGLAIGPDGSLFITDTGNHAVRRLDPGGILTTYAGSGLFGFSGDNGPAKSARLNEPNGIAVDNSGRLFIADTRNHRIRVVDTSGIISTFAGTGMFGFSGDGGPALRAQFRSPRGVAVATDGSVYIADASNYLVRKVDTDGGISTIAGSGRCCMGGLGGSATEANLSFGISGLAVGTRGIYISNSSEVLLVSPDGKISRVVGSGDGRTSQGEEAASVNSPVVNGAEDLVLTADETLYFADSSNHRVRRVVDGKVYTVAGTGMGLGDRGMATGDGAAATEAKLREPTALQVAGDGALFFVDRFNSRVRRIGTDGTISTLAGTGDPNQGGFSGPAAQARIIQPEGLALGEDGSVYIADTGRVLRVAPNGTMTVFAGGGSLQGTAADGGPATRAYFGAARGMAFTRDGRLLIIDGNRLRAVTRDGIISTLAGNGEFGGASPDGAAATSVPLGVPWTVAVAPDDTIYYAEFSGPGVGFGRIRRIDSNGIVSTVLGEQARLGFIQSLAFGPDGLLYFADWAARRVYKRMNDGRIVAVAGSGAQGFGGEGWSPLQALLSDPKGIAFGPDGSLYISDSGNNRIRKVTF